jgi:hypothetical protein
MAPLRRHRTSPRVIGRKQADAEGQPLIHLGFLDGAATPWAVAGRGPSQGASTAVRLPASPSPGPLVVGMGSVSGGWAAAGRGRWGECARYGHGGRAAAPGGVRSLAGRCATPAAAARGDGWRARPAVEGWVDGLEAVAQRRREQVVSGLPGLGCIAVAAPGGWTALVAVAASPPGSRLRWSPGWPMVAWPGAARA